MHESAAAGEGESKDPEDAKATTAAQGLFNDEGYDLLSLTESYKFPARKQSCKACRYNPKMRGFSP